MNNLADRFDYTSIKSSIMGKQVLFYVFVLLLSCTSVHKKQNETLKANEHNLVDEQNLTWKALNSYVGKYSKDTDFFKNDLVENQLKMILADDYEDYMKFVESAGCGVVEKIDNIIYGDVSMMHVGGCNSLFLIDTEERDMYIFWLTKTVREKDYQIYGKRPIPETVKKIIVDDMNTGWGHVATFVFHRDSLAINDIQ